MIGRYDVVSELGRSSSGAVYVAVDRLTGQTVALRRVTIATLDDRRVKKPGRIDRRKPSGARLRLSRQLQLIATLRHPNLVGIIDYGFDSGMRPFYTQRLIEQPLELLDVAREQPLPTRLDLLIQMLHGLAYLHRHGAVHGDLRSRTALVDGEGTVRLVNFGLAALREADGEPEASYVAPEVVRGGSASRAADLYAAGVLAFEVLAKRPASQRESWETGVGMPDISTRDFDAKLIPVLETLLASAPRDRYRDASAVIDDLCSALEIETPVETAAIRESYLQRARFVGREPELARLKSLLKATMDGHGGSLIISGESGVGKSRLLEELRVVSLAEGAVVLQGRAVAEGFSPYHSWRQVLRHLCLLVEVEETEAAVLADQIPDIGNLLGREVGEAPALDPMAGRQRLVELIQRLFGKLEQPAVMMLDDLHWMGPASLGLFEQLQSLVDGLPLLLLGSYRDDERPDLAVELAGMPELKLSRLGRDVVGQLAQSMLGPLGRNSSLVDFLHRETAGNLLFLVEVVRALGQEAGRLDRIDPSRLPEQISTGGIQRVLKRRLQRLPSRIRPMLRLAAVVGRDLDLELLSRLEPGLHSSAWLRLCSDQAVLEAADGQWRFTTDRYREALLDGMSAGELRADYRRVAEASTRIHGRSADRVPVLAYYWSRAADRSDPEATQMAVDYLERAGRAALESCATQEAQEQLRRGLGLLDILPGDHDQQEVRLQVSLGGALMMSKGFTAPEVGQAFGRAHSLCQRTGDVSQLMPALLGLWRFHVVRAELATALSLAEEMFRHAEAQRRSSYRFLAEYTLGTTILFQGEPESASRHLQVAIDLYAKLHVGSRREIAASSFYLGQNPGVAVLGLASWTMWLLGYPEHARALSRRAVALADELGHLFSSTFAGYQQAWLDHMCDDPEATAMSARSVVEASRERGFSTLLQVGLIFQGWALARLGRRRQGIQQMSEALEELRASGSELFKPCYQALLAEAYGIAGRPEEGLETLAEAVQHADRYGCAFWKPEFHRLRSELYLALPKPSATRAGKELELALADSRSRHEKMLELRALIDLARLRCDDEPQLKRILGDLGKLYRGFSEGLETPDLVAARELLGIA